MKYTIEVAIVISVVLIIVVSARPQFNGNSDDSSRRRQQIDFSSLFARVPSTSPSQRQQPGFIFPGNQQIQGQTSTNQNVNQFIDGTTSTTSAPTVVTTPSQRYLGCMAACPSTNEYNPICGSDSQNYHNNGRLQCAIRCGQPVSAVRRGTCEPL